MSIKRRDIFNGSYNQHLGYLLTTKIVLLNYKKFKLISITSINKAFSKVG
jgi:hypothetical protein